MQTKTFQFHKGKKNEKISKYNFSPRLEWMDKVENYNEELNECLRRQWHYEVFDFVTIILKDLTNFTLH